MVKPIHEIQENQCSTNYNDFTVLVCNQIKFQLPSRETNNNFFLKIIPKLINVLAFVKSWNK